MPSRTDRRIVVERVVRAVALVALAVTLLRLVAAASDEPEALHARFDAAPSALVRDSLAALTRSGERVGWSGEVTPVAAMAEGLREPRPAARVSVIAGSPVLVADSLGMLDSLGTGGGSVTIAIGADEGGAGGLEGPGALRVSERGTTARVGSIVAPEPGRLLVLGRAGWEAKFVVAALEEAGWRVDTRLRLSDTMQVAQGRAGAPQLGTHAVVVVLDSTLGDAGAGIVRFVRSGGGLVLAGAGTRTAALASLAPARAERRLAPESRSFEEGDPLHALPLYALAAPRRDAIVLETRAAVRDGTGAEWRAVAARREGLGRVVQSGYAETWRWRMEGGTGSVAAQREWWSRLVALAAPSHLRNASTASIDEGAPLAVLVQALGAPTDAPSRARPRGPPLPLWLGGLVLLLLLGEWALRRTRGAA